MGTELYLSNVGPDEPFGGGVPGVDFAAADPGTTGQVMKFKVVKRYLEGHEHHPGEADAADGHPPGRVPRLPGNSL